jgi:hypothetical protein
MRVASTTCTVMARTKRRPKSRICPVVSGTKIASSMSPPNDVAPFAASTPTTWNGTLLTSTYCPTGSASPKTLSATVVPSTTTGAYDSTSACEKNVPRRTGQLRASA